MRTAQWGAGLLAILALGTTAIAQGPSMPAPTVETHSHTSTAPVPVYRPYREETSSMTQRLIYERAAYRARQRQARLESQRWLGISTLRPSNANQRVHSDLNPVYVGWHGWGFPAQTLSPWVR